MNDSERRAAADREFFRELYPDLDLDAEKAKFLSHLHPPINELAAKMVVLTPALMGFYCR